MDSSIGNSTIRKSRYRIIKKIFYLLHRVFSANTTIPGLYLEDQQVKKNLDGEYCINGVNYKKGRLPYTAIFQIFNRSFNDISTRKSVKKFCDRRAMWVSIVDDMPGDAYMITSLETLPGGKGSATISLLTKSS